ncbi:hypothetical protein MKW94_022884 [Papaver nudicaule]|uniref:MORF/ORRM1/DAG-like MORF domain-containing protein n=1 Tax=Papaver nudicaule TaxID=74823 RepID=A0AA41S2J0_PAPNU|nr:hypothetical protein [Papaver nudicaule]
MKIYSVSTRCYFAFGALVSEDLSEKIKALPGVLRVLPDSYLDIPNQDYGGEPFVNGKAVPYDPKYHEAWMSNCPAKDREYWLARAGQKQEPNGLYLDHNGNWHVGSDEEVDEGDDFIIPEGWPKDIDYRNLRPKSFGDPPVISEEVDALIYPPMNDFRIFWKHCQELEEQRKQKQNHEENCVPDEGAT